MDERPILILGLGVSGKAAAAFSLKEGHQVIGADQKSDEMKESLAQLLEQGLQLVRDTDPIADVSLLVLSPGIPLSHPLVQEALQKKIEVIGEVELAFRYIRNRCIGITGSNGKTTTVLLTTHLLNRAGMQARALGNVGVGLSSYLLDPNEQEILVVELSSFQLETLKEKKLDAAAILNITPNHLDRYPSMQEYARAKLSIEERLKEGGELFVSEKMAEEYGPFFAKTVIYDEGAREELASIERLRYTQWGMPERQNVLAAFALSKRFGVSEADLEKGLATFRKPPHRIEWVAEIDGTAYYNDSKSSNIESVMHAVRLFDGPIVLVAGGTDKGSSYRPWIECFRGKVKKIIAYGLAAPKMEAELAGDFPFETKGPFRDAVLAAHACARKQDTVLLSPGCSSYDQFKSYERRGEAFKQIVNELREQWTEKKQS